MENWTLQNKSRVFYSMRTNIFRYITWNLAAFSRLVRNDTHMTSMKIVQFSRPPLPLHLRPKFFHPLHLERPISINIKGWLHCLTSESKGRFLVNNILKSNFRPPKKKMFYLLQWQPFKNGEKCFLFHLKSSFRSQDI